MVWILCLLGLVAVSVTANQCDSHANGCSIPFNLNYFYKDLFTPSCNKHDICYACGAKFGVSRASCDSKFKQNMASACTSLRRRSSDEDEKRGVNRAFCNAVVYDYYLAVRVGGGSHYRSAGNTVSFCGQSWVRSCF